MYARLPTLLRTGFCCFIFLADDVLRFESFLAEVALRAESFDFSFLPVVTTFAFKLMFTGFDFSKSSCRVNFFFYYD